MKRYGRNRQDEPWRLGTTLIEIIVTMTIASSLLLIATTWIHQSFFLSSKMRENGRHHDQLMRLSRQFRDDVHQADSIQSISETEFVLISDESRIEYSFDGSAVTRHRVNLDEQSPMSRDRYRLKNESTLAWTTEDNSWIVLSVKRPAVKPARNSPRRSDLHVRARLGRLRKETS